MTSLREAGGGRAKVLRALPWALAPALALLAVRLVSDASSAGRFQSGLAALTLAVVVAARPRAAPGSAWMEVGGAALFAGGAYLAVGAGPGGALALVLLALGVGCAAWGLQRLGLALGAPSFPAFAVASLVLFTAMLGLYWADPGSAWVEKRGRRAFRQAVLQVDPALALAYDGAGHDRLRAPTVYFAVPLASSAYELPRAPATSAAWLLVGLAAGAIGAGIDARGRSVGRRRSPAS